MTPGELFQADRLTEAVEAALATVKRDPTDTSARYLLGELLCLAGHLERADRQLETVATQTPQAAVRVSLLRQLIRAEQARRQFSAEGRLPEFLVEASPMVRLYLDASIALRAGDRSQATEILDRAEQQRTPLSGTCDGAPFSDFRDLDDTIGGLFEVLTSNGKFYLVPMDIVQVLEFRPPQRPLDLLWRQVRMAVENGPDGEVYMPSIYASTYARPEDALLMGRATHWQDEPLPVQGFGQRTFLTGDEAKAIGELKTVQFSPPASGAGAGPGSEP